MRDVCLQYFNVKLPDKATFQHEGQDLTHYPAVVTTMTRLWPGEEALAFMDTCIFLHTKTKAKIAFDLAAFRDLLTLHTVGEDLVASATQPPNPQAVKADQAPDPMDRPLDAQDVFPQWELPENKFGMNRTESPEENLPGLDFVLPQEPPRGKP